MKVRIIKIEACNECPYFETRTTSRDMQFICNLSEYEIPNAQSIPDWCSLEGEENNNRKHRCGGDIKKHQYFDGEGYWYECERCGLRFDESELEKEQEDV